MFSCVHALRFSHDNLTESTRHLLDKEITRLKESQPKPSALIATAVESTVAAPDHLTAFQVSAVGPDAFAVPVAAAAPSVVKRCLPNPLDASQSLF